MKTLSGNLYKYVYIIHFVQWTLLRFFREVFYVDECRKLSDLMNFFSSWCIYNNYCEVNGEAAGKGILEEFANK